MLDMLQAYVWPGNVRELSNLVDRFSTLFPSQTLQVHSVPACMMPSGMAALQAQRLSASPKREPETPAALVLAAAEPSGLHANAQAATLPAPPEPCPWGASDPLTHLLFGGDTPKSMQPPRPNQPVSFLGAGAELGFASNDEMSSVEEVILLAQGIATLPPDGISLKQHLIDIERHLIEQALNRTSGNVSQTARLLQLQRTTLIEKINKYELRAVG
jgi:sigma-54 specific flagellar transcriptional regulator A